MSWRRSPRCGAWISTLRLGAGRQRRRHQFRILDLVREQDEARRGLVVVELREEGGQHLLRAHRLVGLREIGAVAPVLPVAEEEHLDAELAGLLVEGEHVRLLDRLRVDALHALDRRERREPVAVARRALEFERPRPPACISSRDALLHGVRLARRGTRAPPSARLAYSSSEISCVHGPEQRLIWNSRQGRVRFS